MNAQEEDNFEVVILGILKRLSRGMNEQSNLRLKSLGERLLDLHENAETDLTQSVMELICARELIVSGYMVNVEYSLDHNGSDSGCLVHFSACNIRPPGTVGEFGEQYYVYYAAGAT